MNDIDWHKYFVYDATSPSFLRWKIDIMRGKNKDMFRVRRGDVAGCKSSVGYYTVGLHRHSWLCHQIIVKMFNPEFIMGTDIDHKDGDTYNNDINNLRPTTVAINSRNRKMYTTNSSGVTGVSLNKSRTGRSYWRARWWDMAGKEQSKNFPVLSLGYEEAFRLACEYRQQILTLLNSQGAGYTDRHGEKHAVC